ncbi:hypothetical protein O181_056221 [Austropuccinia psidii MF-1]|uniref:Chromatin assembly factor 1 subunit A dimerization domain-containing protein n=1 Tax=Austropuccinia psidii MF-1 TaxID=1389203 RepID=A0A9Q3HSR2_9BASI|nr:hypothetical protein [Austropuccinia psidii MF-1]
MDPIEQAIGDQKSSLHTLKRKSSITLDPRILNPDSPIKIQHQSSSSSHHPASPILSQSITSNKKLKHSIDKSIPTSPSQPIKSIVEFDKTRAVLTIKQKPIELCEVSNSIKKSLVAVTEELESSKSQILDLSFSQKNLVASLAHESDKTLPELVEYVHSKLLPQSKLENSENTFDPLPKSILESVIKLVAKRINYAPDQSDFQWLPSSLPKSFQIWRWECNDPDSVIPTELQELYIKRYQERQLIKPQIVAILSDLNTTERELLVKKLTPAKRRSKANTNSGQTPSKPSKANISINTQESNLPSQLNPSEPSSSIQQPIITQETLEKIPTEKELAKLEKERKKREKEEAKQAEEQQRKKMGNMMTGWMMKATTNTVKPKSHSTLQANSGNQTSDSNEMQISGSGDHPVEGSKHILSDFETVFKPFNLKSNMHLAPINRFRSTSSHLHNKPNQLNQSIPYSQLTPQLSLEQFLKSVPQELRPQALSKSKRMTTVREIVNGIAENEISGSVEETKKWRRALQNRWVVPVKFLRFHEDVRPGYIGTWCKTSRLVSGRTPFGKDTCLLDYDYDSEVEWNEEDGEGEDLGGSDDLGGEDGMSSEGGESDEDGWLVGDDDEIEMIDDDENQTNHLVDGQLDGVELIKTSSKKISGPGRRKIVGPLIPIVKGPMWEETLGQVPTGMLEPFRIQFINDAPLGLNPFEYEPKAHKSNKLKIANVSGKPLPSMLPLPLQMPTTTIVPNAELKSIGQFTSPLGPALNLTNEIENQPNSISKNKPTFPIELLPKLLTIVNGNRKSKPLLIEDIRLAFLDFKLSKRLIEKTLNDIAIKVSGVWRIIDIKNNNAKNQ